MKLQNFARLTIVTISRNPTTASTNYCPLTLSVLTAYVHVDMILFYLFNMKCVTGMFQ